MSDNIGNRIADSIETALKISEGLVLVEIVKINSDSDSDLKDGEIILFSENFCCPVSGFSILEIEPRLFSFNSPYGACKFCDGLGTELYFNPELVVTDQNLSLLDGAISIWQGSQNRYYRQIIIALSKKFNFQLEAPYSSLSNEIKKYIILR